MVSSVLVEKSLRYPVHRGVNQDTQKSQLFTRCTVPNNNLNFRVKTEPVTVGASACTCRQYGKNNYERWWGWMKLHEEKKSRDTGLGDILWHIIWKVKISIDFDHQKRKMCEWTLFYVAPEYHIWYSILDLKNVLKKLMKAVLFHKFTNICTV